MEWLNDFAPILTAIAAVISAIAVFLVARWTMKHSKQQEELNRLHLDSLTAQEHANSKEAHTINHFHTRKTIHLEHAGKLLGEIKFWAEKCVVSRTRTQFGTHQQIAAKMSLAFEKLSKYEMCYPYAFKNKNQEKFQEKLGELMALVNNIENMTHSMHFNKDSYVWKTAIKEFEDELKPFIERLQTDLNKLLEPAQPLVTKE